MRLNRSILLATIIALAAVAWIMSGQLSERPATASSETASAPTIQTEQPILRVRVMESAARDHVATLRSSGQTEAARIVTVRAETAGRVERIGTEKGTAVDAGAVIVALDKADRPARLAETKARVEQRTIEYEAARQLAARGFQAETRRAEALADLEDARAYRREIEIDLGRTEIKAPIAGVVDTRPVEIGDYVNVSDVIATVVELDPLLVTAQVSERQAPQIEVGMPARALLSSGDEIFGVVRYTASVADADTRTFRVEIEIANPGNYFGQGLTAEISLDLPPVAAHRVSPSIFRLDPDGHIGVMVVDESDRARFRRVTIIDSDATGTWIRGLPNRARIVVVGQELVDEGDSVVPVPVDQDTTS